jgi:SAM-dependent methyltransferase
MDPKFYDREVWELEGDATAPVDTPPCPICGGTSARPRFAIEDLESRIVVCTGCGLGSLFPAPSAEAIAAFYPEEYYGAAGRKFRGLVETLVRLVGSRHVQFLAAGLPPGARVLDVGCGRGVLLSALADRGLEAHGVEATPAAARGADPRARIAIAPRLSDAHYPAGFFDEVIVWHVFEHLPDPMETLREIRRILKDGGRLVVAVPNFESRQARWAGPGWFHLDPPRHLSHFPLSGLRTILEHAGFECLSSHHFSLRQNPFGWLQSALNRWTKLPRNGLYVLLHEREPDEPAPYDRATRWKLRLCYALGAPLAILASEVDTVLRTGATVHIVARAGKR